MKSGRLLEKVGWVSEMRINGSGAMRKRINRNKGSSSEWRFSCSKTEDGVVKKKKKMRVKGGTVCMLQETQLSLIQILYHRYTKYQQR